MWPPQDHSGFGQGRSYNLSQGQVVFRIHRPVVHPHFVMQMRRGSSSGSPDEADDLASLDSLANLDESAGEMAEARSQAVAVIYNDQISIRVFPIGKNDHAIRRCVDLGVIDCRNIQTQVKLGLTVE